MKKKKKKGMLVWVAAVLSHKCRILLQSEIPISELEFSFYMSQDLQVGALSSKLKTELKTEGFAVLTAYLSLHMQWSRPILPEPSEK